MHIVNVGVSDMISAQNNFNFGIIFFAIDAIVCAESIKLEKVLKYQ